VVVTDLGGLFLLACLRGGGGDPKNIYVCVWMLRETIALFIYLFILLLEIDFKGKKNSLFTKRTIHTMHAQHTYA